jgi:hypothetical protein
LISTRKCVVLSKIVSTQSSDTCPFIQWKFNCIARLNSWIYVELKILHQKSRLNYGTKNHIVWFQIIVLCNMCTSISRTEENKKWYKKEKPTTRINLEKYHSKNTNLCQLKALSNVMYMQILTNIKIFMPQKQIIWARIKFFLTQSYRIIETICNVHIW